MSATFRWRIKNLSYCWLNKGEPIESPTFDFNWLVSTKWALVLYPRGIITEDHVGIYLRRDSNDNGRNIIEASFHFAFLNRKGLCVHERNGSRRGFARGSVSGIGEFLTQDKVFGTERQKFFPRDVLIVQCTLRFQDKIFDLPKHIDTVAVTSFRLISRSFSWRIDEFSTLSPGRRNHFVVLNKSKMELLKFNLVSGFESTINLQMIFCDESVKSLSFTIFVIDCEGEKVNFGSHNFFAAFVEINKLLITREQLTKNESRYLPNDVLSLNCEFALSVGDIFHVCESCNFGIISPKVTLELKEKRHSQNEPQQTKPLVNDLKSMYDDAILSDIQLPTSIQTFPAHKNILSSRSPVFRSMFSSDMREKNSGYVDITDLEDDTVHQMLTYIYTDALEDLQFESALKLYSAADKYAIFSLKERCSCFLKENASPTNACDLLSLADIHQDDDLKCAVLDYILHHDKDIFGSLEWKNFMATNLQLAADIMYRKVCPT